MVHHREVEAAILLRRVATRHKDLNHTAVGPDPRQVPTSSFGRCSNVVSSCISLADQTLTFYLQGLVCSC